MTERMDADDFARKHGIDALSEAIARGARPYMNGHTRDHDPSPRDDEGVARAFKREANDGWQPKGRRTISADDVSVDLAVEYVLKGWIYRGDFVTIFGAPGCGKSLFAAHMFYRVAQGCAETFGKRARKAVVLYVVLEGERGFKHRIVGLRERYGRCRDFHLDTEGSLDLANPHVVETLCEAAKRVGAAVIVIDTWAQATAECVEGTSDEQRALAGINRLRRATGAAVVTIDHTGFGEGDVQKRTRGWSGKWAATDVALHVDGDVKLGDVRVVPRRLKDGVGFEAIVFGSERVVLGADEDGDQVATFVAVERDAALMPMPTRSDQASKPEARSLAVFRAAFNEASSLQGFPHRVMGDGPTVQAVRVEHVREQFGRLYATGEGEPGKQADATRKAFNRTLEKLAREYPGERLADGVEVLWRLRSAAMDSSDSPDMSPMSTVSGNAPDTPDTPDMSANVRVSAATMSADNPDSTVSPPLGGDRVSVSASGDTGHGNGNGRGNNGKGREEGGATTVSPREDGHEGKDAVETHDLRGNLLTLLAAATQPMTQAELCELLPDASRASIGLALRRMVDRGEVRRVGADVYAMAKAPTEPRS